MSGYFQVLEIPLRAGPKRLPIIAGENGTFFIKERDSYINLAQWASQWMREN
jgi:hypothetical protein